MLRRRLYYAIKPFLPWGMRMAVRRIFARRKREQSKDIWPIDESTSRPPEGWPGWPEGKKFAFVLTHDVEGPEGLAKVRQLAELEMKLGFRSSFNFIPEGPYQVPPELRAWLTTNGFEVGVHDLHHDGKLFSSRRGFAEKAKKINNYLREWQARGYRSGFMLRDLGWLHDLDIQYDASTFDTDPFEPQAESAGTIFPYWISSPEAPEAKGKAVSAEGPNTQFTAHISPPLPPSPFPPSPASLSSVPSTVHRPLPGDGPDIRPGVSRDAGRWTHPGLPAGSNRAGRGTNPVSLANDNRAHRVGSEPTTVPGSRSGYVELPYTLPQDSTLFLLLQEKSPEIWLRKLDWIVAQGGMALVNVHPDYINLGTRPDKSKEYPAEAYAALLIHVAGNYAGQFWNPLPRDLARWYTQNCRLNGPNSIPPFRQAKPVAREVQSAKSHLHGKRAAVLLYSRYPSDPRPRRAAEAMIEAGMQVDLLCLASDPTDIPSESVCGVSIFRVQLTHRRDNKWIYVWQYGRFFFFSFWFLLTRGLRFRYDVIHVHNMPDFLVFAALIPKLRGASIILDLHDPMPELMESIYNLKAGDWKVHFLRRLERWSIHFADAVLTPNITFKNLFVARKCPPDKIQIVMNSPRQDIFNPDIMSAPRVSKAASFRIMHHGLIAHRHGIDLLVAAIAQLRPKIPGVQLDIYGSQTSFLDTVLEVARQLNVADIVHYHGAKSQSEIAHAIEECDLGVVPNRRSSFTELNFPTRIFEYLAMYRPVIAPPTRGIRDYFDEENLFFFEPDNPDNLANKILWIYLNPKSTTEVVLRGRTVYQMHLWNSEKTHFLSLVNSLLTGKIFHR